MINLTKALNDPIWLSNTPTSLYTMDGKNDRWKIVYYPILQDGKTNEYYEEPRALVQNIDKPGFWSKEVPLRYLNHVNPNS